MPRKKPGPEEIAARLRVDVLVSQRQSLAEAVRSTGVTPFPLLPATQGIWRLEERPGQAAEGAGEGSSRCGAPRIRAQGRGSGCAWPSPRTWHQDPSCTQIGNGPPHSGRPDWVAALPVSVLAADDCLLWLWTTNPMLPQAFAVMDACGLTFKPAAATRLVRLGRPGRQVSEAS